MFELFYKSFHYFSVNIHSHTYTLFDVEIEVENDQSPLRKKNLRAAILPT